MFQGDSARTVRLSLNCSGSQVAPLSLENDKARVEYRFGEFLVEKCHKVWDHCCHCFFSKIRNKISRLVWCQAQRAHIATDAMFILLPVWFPAIDHHFGVQRRDHGAWRTSTAVEAHVTRRKLMLKSWKDKVQAVGCLEGTKVPASQNWSQGVISHICLDPKRLGATCDESMVLTGCYRAETPLGGHSLHWSAHAPMQCLYPSNCRPLRARNFCLLCSVFDFRSIWFFRASADSFLLANIQGHAAHAV